MGLSHEHVGPNILAKIKIYVLTRAELLFPLCYEVPCNRERLLRSRQFQSECIWSPTYQFKGQISLKLDSIDKNDMSLRMTRMKSTVFLQHQKWIV